MCPISRRDANCGASSRNRRFLIIKRAPGREFRVSPRASHSDDARSSRDADVGSLENPSRSEKISRLSSSSPRSRCSHSCRAPNARRTNDRAEHPSPFAFAPRARSQHDRRRPPRQGASARGRRETRGARLLRDPAHLLAPRHRCVPPVPRVAHRRAHRTVRPVARATMRAERGRTRHAREGSLRLFASASRCFSPSPHRRV